MRARLALLLSIVCVFPTITLAQIPDTLAERRLSAWLAAFNSANRDSLGAFYQQHYPSAAARVEQMLDFRARTGGFELVKITTSTPTRVAAYLQERASDQFAEASVDLDSTPPHHVTALRINAIERPAEFAIRRLDQSALAQATQAQAEHDATADLFAGAVLIAQNGKPILQSAHGLADRERKIQNTLDTRFRLGSMNKMFTATAVLQLVQAGKVKLDAPLATYLPDYPNKDLASKVTIHHLLTHTGGTGDIFTPEYETHRLELRTLADYVKLYGSRPLEFEPGAQWAYSNYGFILLGRVIERVSGMTYYEYVAKHIYAPARMTASGSDPEDSLVKGRAIGYTKQQSPNGNWQPNTNTLPWRGTSAGGGYSTVGDLLRFAEALRDDTLLDARHTELLTSMKATTPGGGQYAYGFGITMSNGLRCFGHNGGAPGMNGDLAICDGGYVIAVLANMDPPAAGRISTFIKHRLPASSQSKPNASQ